MRLLFLTWHHIYREWIEIWYNLLKIKQFSGHCVRVSKNTCWSRCGAAAWPGVSPPGDCEGRSGAGTGWIKYSLKFIFPNQSCGVEMRSVLGIFTSLRAYHLEEQSGLASEGSLNRGESRVLCQFRGGIGVNESPVVQAWLKQFVETLVNLRKIVENS